MSDLRESLAELADYVQMLQENLDKPWGAEGITWARRTRVMTLRVLMAAVMRAQSEGTSVEEIAQANNVSVDDLTTMYPELFADDGRE